MNDRLYVIWRYHRKPKWWHLEDRRVIQLFDDYRDAERCCKVLEKIDPEGYFSVVDVSGSAR